MKKRTVRDKRLKTTGLLGFPEPQNRYSNIGLIRKREIEGMTMWNKSLNIPVFPQNLPKHCAHQQICDPNQGFLSC